MEVKRRAFDRRVHVLHKPFTKEQLASIFDEARSLPTPPPRDRLAGRVAWRAREWGFSPTQREILGVLSANEKRPHEETAHALGMKPNTLRAHLRAILERSGLASVDALRDTLLRDSLSLSARGGPVSPP